MAGVVSALTQATRRQPGLAAVAGVGGRELGLADAAQTGDGADHADARARLAQRGHQVRPGLEGGSGLGDVAGHDRAPRLAAGEQVDLDVAVAELDALASGYVHALRPFVIPIVWKTLEISGSYGPFEMIGWGALEF